MANHSLIKLRRPITPEDVEQAVAKINQRRFGGRLNLTSTEELTRGWQAAKAWILEAPNTRPKNPDKFFNLDENLGYCFWLTKDRLHIETRHSIMNGWIRWVMNICEHELARYFDIRNFDCGDGMERTDPEQYKTNYYDWVTRNFKQPLSEDDAAYLQRFVDEIPEGWS